MRKIATLSALFAVFFVSDVRADEVLVRASADFSALVLQARAVSMKPAVQPAARVADLGLQARNYTRSILEEIGIPMARFAKVKHKTEPHGLHDYYRSIDELGGNDQAAASKAVLDAQASLGRLQSDLRGIFMSSLGPDGEAVSYAQAADAFNDVADCEDFMNGLVLVDGDHLQFNYGVDPASAGNRAQNMPGAIRDNRHYIMERVRLGGRPDMVRADAPGSNPDLMAAVVKLSGADPAKMNRFGTFTKDGKRGVCTMAQALADFQEAMGAIPESKLTDIRGFAAPDVLLLISDWLGQEGLAKFQYHLTLADNGVVTLYDITMLDQWVQANAVSLDRVLHQGWVQMPIEKSALWAAEELAVRKGLGGTDSLLTATPKALYVQRQDYPGFMELYRDDKRALSGEEIAGAISGFKVDLVAKLEEMRQAQMSIARAVDSNTSAMGGLSGEMAGVRRAINMGTLTNILLRFVH